MADQRALHGVMPRVIRHSLISGDGEGERQAEGYFPPAMNQGGDA
ncbi:hypothetical protein [Klebsiella grimontii]|nr:hypothetical protein [Klebsiella grimontii]WDI70486.1 hypothetical protein PU992_01785 [Klebsiella grimontii]